MKPGPTGKLWLNRLGGFLGVLGVVFVGARLFAYRSDLSLEDWTWQTYGAVVVLCCAYGAINLCLALGWHALLSHLQAPQSVFWSVRIYAVTQIAKYLPGNIFQFAGRQALGAAVGIPHKTLLKSALWEVILLALAASCFLPMLAHTRFPISQIAAFGAFGVSVLLMGLAVVLFAPKSLKQASAGYAGQVVLSSMIFLCVYTLVGGDVAGALDMITVMAAFAVSWLIGLLTPGAPAGLGVREAALIFFLSGIAGPAIVLTAALLGRVVTTIGDLLFFGFGRLVR